MKRADMSHYHKAEVRRYLRLWRLRLTRNRDEYFCPKDFHHYSGVDVCLSLCRKSRCSVFQSLVKSERLGSGASVSACDGTGGRGAERTLR